MRAEQNLLAEQTAAPLGLYHTEPLMRRPQKAGPCHSIWASAALHTAPTFPSGRRHGGDARNRPRICIKHSKRHTLEAEDAPP